MTCNGTSKGRHFLESCLSVEEAPEERGEAPPNPCSLTSPFSRHCSLAHHPPSDIRIVTSAALNLAVSDVTFEARALSPAIRICWREPQSKPTRKTKLCEKQCLFVMTGITELDIQLTQQGCRSFSRVRAERGSGLSDRGRERSCRLHEWS